MEDKDKKQDFLPIKKKRSWKKTLAFVVFILLNAIVIAVTASSEFGNSTEAAKLSEVKLNWWLLIPAVICFVVAITLDINRYVLMIRKMRGKDEKKAKLTDVWKVARRTVLLGKYYDSVTPAAIGGQPFQIYYMRKNSGLSHGASTSIPLVGMIANQIGFLIIAISCFLFSGIMYTKPALMVTAWIGLLFFAFWPIMVAGVSFFPKATTKFLKWLVKVLAKLHVVKKRDKALDKIEDEVSGYAKSVKVILKEKGLFFRVIIMSVAYNALIMMIPFFVLTAFGGDVRFIECFALSVAVTSAVYFVPTPGNTGAAEGTFFLVFSALSTGYVFWAMLFWRFFSYYIYIIIGPIIYFFMQLEKRRDTKKV